MQLDCKLFKKTFTAKDSGEIKEYYVLQFPLYDGEKLEITIKSDKARLLAMANALEKKD